MGPTVVLFTSQAGTIFNSYEDLKEQNCKNLLTWPKEESWQEFEEFERYPWKLVHWHETRGSESQSQFPGPCWAPANTAMETLQRCTDLGKLQSRLQQEDLAFHRWRRQTFSSEH